MQPWKISVGFTVIIIAIAGMIGGEHFAFVEPHFQIIFTDYWVALAWYGEPPWCRLWLRSTLPLALSAWPTSASRSI